MATETGFEGLQTAAATAPVPAGGLPVVAGVFALGRPCAQHVTISTHASELPDDVQRKLFTAAGCSPRTWVNTEWQALMGDVLLRALLAMGCMSA